MKRSPGLLATAVLAALTFALLSAPAHADFVNGGFESGSWTGWTLGGGTWQENPQNSGNVTYSPTGDPGKSQIVTPGFDANTNNNLNMVYNGNYAARVNNYDNGYHYTTLEQQVAGWDQNTIYFSWAAVLEEPSAQHSDAAAPHFAITLHDVTTNTDLYTQAFNVYHPPSGVSWNAGADSGDGTWMYTNWVVAQLDTTHYRGDTLDLTVAAYDCGWGGHGGYAYVDVFGPAPTEQTGTPEPSTLLLMGLGVTGCITRFRKRKATARA